MSLSIFPRVSRAAVASGVQEGFSDRVSSSHHSICPCMMPLELSATPYLGPILDLALVAQPYLDGIGRKRSGAPGCHLTSDATELATGTVVGK